MTMSVRLTAKWARERKNLYWMFSLSRIDINIVRHFKLQSEGHTFTEI